MLPPLFPGSILTDSLLPFPASTVYYWSTPAQEVVFVVMRLEIIKWFVQYGICTSLYATCTFICQRLKSETCFYYTANLSLANMKKYITSMLYTYFVCILAFFSHAVFIPIQPYFLFGINAVHLISRT